MVNGFYFKVTEDTEGGSDSPHRLRLQKEGRRPHLSLHSSTENLVGFLAQIPLARGSTCLGGASAKLICCSELPCFNPVKIRV